MPVAKVVTAQRDFSAGEADIWLKRADEHPMMKRAGRQMSNWRKANSGALFNRPGRRILALEGPRVDEILMSPGNLFYLAFGNNYLRVYNAAFAKVFDSGNVMPWSTATAPLVVWDIYKLAIYITYGDNFPNNVPQVLTWDGVSQSSTWTLANYSPRLQGGQLRNIFFRLSPLGITVQPSAVSGSVTLTASAPVFVSGQIGTRIRYVNQQILITAVNSPTSAVGTVEEQLFNSNTNNITSIAGFNIGDAVIDKQTGCTGIVTSFVSNSIIVIQTTFPSAFNIGDTVVGPAGTAVCTGHATGAPQPIVVWDDEVMNNFRGWPRSCFVDQGRLGFCDFPALPQLIAWSAEGDFADLYTDANNASQTNAIQELVPGKSRVLYVVPGAEGSEFVVCDNAVYYIPINQNNPLKPGSVAFNTLSASGGAQVKPQRVQQSIIYVDSGKQKLKAIQAIGAYYRPYVIDDLTELHSHLVKTPVAIAVPGGSGQFEENYIYVLNADGSVAVAKFNMASGVMDAKNVGWLPWSGSGTATWISAQQGQSDVILTGAYAPGGIAPVSLVEIIDNTQYLDAAMLYNTVPTSLTPPGGMGPLWWIAGGAVDLMDGLRMMGTYQVDANGFLIPQNNAGEDFTSATLAAGQAWTATFEPFIPAVQPGQDVNQRLRKRRVQRWEIYVQNSTGFTLCRLFGGPTTPTSPAYGTVMSRKRFPAWNQDDDPTKAPPLREQAYSIRPIGRLHDPRFALIKDTPGPLTLLESDLEVSV